MNFFARRSSFLWALAGFAGTALAAALTYTATRPPEWRLYLDEQIPEIDARVPAAVFTPEHRKLEVYLVNDVLRRPAWQAQDAREVASVVRGGYPKPASDKSKTSEELSQFLLHSAASICLGFRLDARAPMSDEAREVILETWLAEIEEEFPERRSNSAVDLIYSDFIDRRDVRAAVERLLDDPDSDVREIVALQLAHLDETRARKAAYESKKQASSKMQTSSKE